MKKLLSIFLTTITSACSVLAANDSNLLTGSVVTDTASTGSKGVLIGLIVVLAIIVIWSIIKKKRRK